jgi:uncharacterized RDD family membrane protein YckC
VAAVAAGRGSRGSWLEGPGAARPVDDESYAGQRLGMPASGPGAVAGFGRRLGALVVDWLICSVIAAAISGHRLFHPSGNAFITPAVFLLEYVALVPLIGCSIGSRLFGFRIVNVNGRRLSLGRVVVRTLLLLLVVPAVVFDRDQRGLHDKAANSVAMKI